MSGSSLHFDGIIDVYDENKLDLEEAAKNGVKVIFHQTTRGLYRVDAAYAKRKNAALAKGFLWAGYHLLSAEDPAAQLDAFLEAEDGSNPQIGLAVDWEHSKAGTMSYATLRTFVEMFNARMKARYKSRYPILYGGEFIRNSSGIVAGDSLLAKCPLWYVRYTHGNLEIPHATWPGYTFWQFDDEKRQWGGAPPSVLPGADFSRYDGTFDTLKTAWPFSGPPV
jgi:GH25 family lysozyme M1 (1,4-beta-N-acetylmuramidase)